MNDYLDDSARATPGEWADHPDRPCADPALGTPRQRARLFHPNRGEDTAYPKSLCGRCPVKDQCLDWAVTTGQKHGIWGGTSERERRRLRRRRPAA